MFTSWLVYQGTGSGCWVLLFPFAGRRGGQIASRYTLITTEPFGHRATADQQAWQSLVATLEQSLRLHAHRPGTLLGLEAYLHKRTARMIGSLSQLIREAALDASTTGPRRSPASPSKQSTSI